ncbi:xylulokinase [Anaerotalea alkaliphila]|uniref:FGGY-family carbohydrate kinase n=1 Tax=Anaerotalea alkaliphila TaxID=2662126 RepID=A0A7X5KN56_9FIRM|nr:FGGY-family carbohydrate kinase [Anaerotalea alkaliphila]NDL67679.1 FGGY-family carbohydrate kinase [Anaerotalea alkaliphila]
MAELLLGIDIGTTNVKAAVYDSDLKFIAEASSEHPTNFPFAGGAEQDPIQWWAGVTAAVKELLGKTQVDARRIAGICVSSQAPALVPIDREGKIVRNAMIWMDRRAEGQCAKIREQLGTKEVLAITGNKIDPYFLLGKMLWFKEKEYEKYAVTDKILQVNGYINYKLTGKCTIDKVHASLTGIYDIHRGTWSQTILQALGLSGNKLPEVYGSTEVIGTVGKEAAQAMGLSEGIPVVAGNVDASSSALESGVLGEGEAVDMTGTSTVLMIGSGRWRSSETLVSMHHPVGNNTLLFGPISSTGASLKWFKDQLGKQETEAARELGLGCFDILNLQAQKANPGANNLVFLPYMAGERAPIWDTNARGVFFGLNFNTTKNDMVRAILEGSAFALRQNMEEAAKMGVEIKNLRAVGGGSKSPLWLQIKASITKTPVITIEKASSGAFGNTLLAGQGIGLYGDIASVLKNNIKFKTVYTPDESLYDRYDKLYDIYKAIYMNTRDEMRKLSQMG